MTFSVLFFSEILPKIAGVTYRRAVARAVSLPLNLVVHALYPLVWLSQRAAWLFQSGEKESLASEEEVYQVAALSAEEGSILPVEAELVKNVLRLNEIKAREIMTPRTVVFKLPAERTVREVGAEITASAHSRIPIYVDDDMEKLVGWVLKSDVLTRLVEGDFDVKLSALAKPLGFVPEASPGHLLLQEFLKRQTHILAVADEYGGVAGIVSLEDVVESLLGEEIVDETDAVIDLRREARKRGLARLAGAATATDGDSSGDRFGLLAMKTELSAPCKTSDRLRARGTAAGTTRPNSRQQWLHFRTRPSDVWSCFERLRTASGRVMSCGRRPPASLAASSVHQPRLKAARVPFFSWLCNSSRSIGGAEDLPLVPIRLEIRSQTLTMAIAAGTIRVAVTGNRMRALG